MDYNNNDYNIFSIYYIIISLLYLNEGLSDIQLPYTINDIYKYIEYAINMNPIFVEKILSNEKINISKINVNLRDTLRYFLNKIDKIDLGYIEYSKENIENVVSNLISIDKNSSIAMIANFDGTNLTTVLSDELKNKINNYFSSFIFFKIMIIPVIINVYEKNLKYHHFTFFLIHKSKKIIYYYDPYCLNSILKDINGELINTMIDFIKINLPNFSNLSKCDNIISNNIMDYEDNIRNYKCIDYLLNDSFSICSMWNRFMINEIIKLKNVEDYKIEFDNIEKTFIKNLYVNSLDYKEYMLKISKMLFNRIKNDKYDLKIFNKSIESYIKKMKS